MLVIVAVHDGRTPRIAIAQPVDRVAIVTQALAALNRGDADGAAAFYTDDATLISGPVCTVNAPCQGAAALRSSVEANHSLHTTITLLSAEVVGSAVVGRWEFRNDRITAAGIERLVEVYIIQVPQAKISLLLSAYDYTDAATVAALAAR